jgi:thiamine kinase-like enzyme
MRAKEKTSKELERENQKLAEEMKEVGVLSEKARSESEKIMNELRESRYEVSSLMKEKEHLSATLELKTTSLNKEIARLKHLLKGGFDVNFLFIVNVLFCYFRS